MLFLLMFHQYPVEERRMPLGACIAIAHWNRKEIFARLIVAFHRCMKFNIVRLSEPEHEYFHEFWRSNTRTGGQVRGMPLQQLLTGI